MTQKLFKVNQKNCRIPKQINLCYQRQQQDVKKKLLVCIVNEDISVGVFRESCFFQRAISFSKVKIKVRKPMIS